MLKKVTSLVLLVAIILQPLALEASAIHTIVRVGFNKNFPPYQFINEEGKPCGLHIDIMDAISRNANITVEYQAYDTGGECIEALTQGTIDVALGVTKNATLGYKLDLTDTLSVTNLCVIASNSIAESVIRNDSTAELLASVENGQISMVLSLNKTQNRSGFGNNTFMLADHQREAIEFLIRGKVDLAVCEKNSALYLLEEHDNLDEYTMVFNYLTDLDYYMALREEDQLLRRKINTGLSEVRITGQYSTLLEKWIISNKNEVSPEIIKNIIIISASVLAAVMIYFIINYRIRRMLQKKVDEQTQELKLINSKLEQNLCQLEAEGNIRTKIIDDSPNGMLMFTDAEDVLLMNRKASELLQLSQTIDYPIAVGSIPPLCAILKQINLFSTEPVIATYGEGRDIVYFRCIIYRMPVKHDQMTWLLSFENVTQEERKKQEQIETEKSRVLNTIIAGISHEIKNPLTAIKTYSMLLEDHREDTKFMDSFSKYVPQEVERINKLVESLLNYARPVKGIMTRVLIMPMLRECTGLTASIARKAGAKVICEGDETVAVIACQDGLRQAIINYLMNAIESVEQKQHRSNDDGVIKVRCCRLEEKCQITIYDNGVGMTREQLHRCMEPFYTGKARGTGLGMPIALQAIKESGGTVQVDSKLNLYTNVSIEFEVMQ